MIAHSSPDGPLREQDSSNLDRSALLVLDVGNTSIALGAWNHGVVSDARRVRTKEPGSFAAEFGELCRRFFDGRPSAVVVASVVPAATDWIGQEVLGQIGYEVAVIGERIPLPIPVEVREPARLGVDRVCAAAAAHDRTGHACTVVDFGTAITIDLVDDAGTFLGGAILPGAGLQAWALAEGTAALPEVTLKRPPHPVGADTVEAICSGICNGIPGAVRAVVEAYATELNHWPQVVATGGDLELFRPSCDFIDSFVPDLTLMGVGLAYVRHRLGAGQ